MRRAILVVDDEEPILFAMKEYFEAQGYDVETANCLADAEALTGSKTFAVVIADLRLSPSGGREGLLLAEGVKKQRPETRVLLLTAYRSPETETEALRLGVEAVLDKPKPLAQIARIVASLLPAQ